MSGGGFRPKLTEKNFQSVKRLLADNYTPSAIRHITGRSTQTIFLMSKTNNIEEYREYRRKYERSAREKKRPAKQSYKETVLEESPKKIDPVTGLVMIKVDGNWVEEYIIEQGKKAIVARSSTVEQRPVKAKVASSSLAEPASILKEMPYIKIPLQNKQGIGKYTLVDADYDGEYLSGYRWVLGPSGYATLDHHPMGDNGKRITVYLHNMAAGPVKPGQIVYHINGDKLDNRGSNLGIGTYKDMIAIREKGYKTGRLTRKKYEKQPKIKWLIGEIERYKKDQAQKNAHIAHLSESLMEVEKKWKTAVNRAHILQLELNRRTKND